jgi:amino acid permease
MSMKKVLGIGTGLASAVYIMTGMFGYVTFAMNPRVDEIMNEQNILKADYGDNKIIKCCLIGVLFVVLFASPFCILPSKDSIEELSMGEDRQKMSAKKNFFVTFAIIFISWLIALTVPTIADAMTILGATTNSGIGFLIPIVFFNKIKGSKGGKFSNEKILSYVVFVTICCCSCVTLYTYINKKLNPDEFH